MSVISCSFDLSELTAAIGRVCDSVEYGAKDPDIGGGMMNALTVNDEYQQRIYWRNSNRGGPWPELARSTKLRRRRIALGKGAPRLPANADIDAIMGFLILVITGQKYRSLAAGNDGHWFFVSDDSMQSGTAIDDAIYHQLGGPRLPRRQIIGPPDEATLRRMSQAIAVGVANMWRSALGMDTGIMPIWNF